MSSQGQPGAARGSQGQPEAARDSQKQPETARGSLLPSGAGGLGRAGVQAGGRAGGYLTRHDLTVRGSTTGRFCDTVPSFYLFNAVGDTVPFFSKYRYNTP